MAYALCREEVGYGSEMHKWFWLLGTGLLTSSYRLGMLGVGDKCVCVDCIGTKKAGSRHCGYRLPAASVEGDWAMIARGLACSIC